MIFIDDVAAQLDIDQKVLGRQGDVLVDARQPRLLDQSLAEQVVELRVE